MRTVRHMRQIRGAQDITGRFSLGGVGGGGVAPSPLPPSNNPLFLEDGVTPLDLEDGSTPLNLET